MRLSLLTRSRTAKIGVRIERQSGQARGNRLAADNQFDRNAGRSAPALDIAHRDRRADARAESPGGDAAEDASGGTDDLGPVAGRRPSLRPQTDPASRRAARKLGADASGAGKAALFAPPLGYRPGKARLDRARRFVDVMPVEAQSRLEPQRIAGPQTDRLDLRLAEKAAGEGDGLLGRQ